MNKLQGSLVSNFVSSERAALFEKLSQALKSGKHDAATAQDAAKYLEILQKDIDKAVNLVDYVENLSGKEAHPYLLNPVEAKAQKSATANGAAPQKHGKEIHVGRMLFKVGKIIDIKKHPDADTLYIETVDVGESQPRTVVSGLVNRIPMEALLNKIAIFCCNLKPVKMRGVESQAMIMCASSENTFEALEPPAGCKIGDRVVCEEFNCTPDTVLNVKERVWEAVQPELRVGTDGVAKYREKPMVIPKLGVVKVPTLTSCKIT